MSATQSKPRAKPKSAASQNGQPNPLAEAIAFEQSIADEAAELRGDAVELDAQLFLRLWPLLRKPIPAGFIQHVGVVKGKPYESTGVRSLQVLIDRMNNVLTPLWWWYEVEYLGEGEDHGKVAEVTVNVGVRTVGPEEPDIILASATSRGGVNQASTLGNLFKGSETNAAKRAFAQIGPGHEVYLGATDLDPDVSEDAAKAQETKPGAGAAQVKTIPAERAALLRDHFDNIPGDATENAKELKLKLGSIGVSGRSVNAALAKLTPAQADDVDGWISEQVDAKAEEPS